MLLRVSQPQDEGVYQASKWLKIQVLLSQDEMASLLSSLEPFWIFPLTGFVSGDPIEVPLFIEEYGKIIDHLKEGKVPTSSELRKVVPVAFTDDLSSLWLQEVSLGKKLCKIGKPIVQVQAHFFSYSRVDHVFRPLSLGPESIFWGVQFSFPQIYQDPKTMELCAVKEGALFRKIQGWMRDFTQPTPFVVDGKKTNVPIRIGKHCFSWVGSHPQLMEQQISVYGSVRTPR